MRSDDMEQKKAVFYARVSSEEEKQMDALTKQIQENMEVVKSKGWVLIDQYVDEGKSGTQTKKREEYNRLFKDMLTDKFEIIVIKDQDRLMRNPKDWYLFIERLVQNGKQLYIYLDNNYYSPDNSFITGIKAIMAEEYSRHLSRKMNNAHKHRQESGSSAIITNRTWGYQNVNGIISIDDEEAKLVRLIFELYGKGYGSRIICKIITDIGFKNRMGKILAESVIRSIVRNPLYKGTVVMNKFHIDFDTKKKIKIDEKEWIYHDNMIPAIVSTEEWEQANSVIDKNLKKLGNKKYGKKTGSNILSSKVICGECGELFWRNQRRTQRQNDNSYDVYWYCSEYYRYGKKNRKKNGCDTLRLKEEEIYSLLEKIGSTIFSQEEQKCILNDILNKISVLMEQEEVTKKISMLQENKSKLIKKREMLLDLLLDTTICKSDFVTKTNDIEQNISEIEIQEESYLKSKINQVKMNKRIADTKKAFLEGQAKSITIPILCTHLKKMVVFSERIEFYFDFLEDIKPIMALVEGEGKKRNFSMCSELGRILSR